MPRRPRLSALLAAGAVLVTGCHRPSDSPPPAPYFSPGYGSSPSPQGPSQGGYLPPGQWVPPPPPSTRPPLFPAPWWPLPPGGAQLPSIPGLPPLPGFPAPPPDAAQRCVDTINQYRATSSLPALARWYPAEACAATQARDDAAAGRPHGSFGRCGELAQNVCPAWRGPAEQMIGPCLTSMWNEGPGGDFARHGHYLTMSSPRYSRVACGFVTSASGEVWAVQDFQ